MASSLSDHPAADSRAAGSGGGRNARAGPWILDPREVACTLRQRLWWVVLPPAALLALALASLFVLPGRYTARATLLIDPQGLQVVANDVAPAARSADASLLLVDSQMQVVSSDDVLRQVVERFGLDRDRFFAGSSFGMAQLGAALFGTAAPARDPKREALRSLRDHLAVQRLGRTFALSIGVTADTRDKAATIAQSVAETYLADDRQMRTTLARGAENALAAQLGVLQADLRDAEDKAQAYRLEQKLVGVRTSTVSAQQLAQMNEQLGTARARAAEQMTRLAEVERALGAGGSANALPEVLQSPTIGALRAQLALAERTLSLQQTRLGNRHPAMIAARDDVAAARAQLDAEVQRIVASLRDQYRSAQANVTQLAQALDKGKPQAVPAGDAEGQLRELERQVDARRSVVDTLLARMRDPQAQQPVGTSASRITASATPPAHRDGVSPTRMLVAALMAGLGLGVGVALLAERRSGRVRTSRRLGHHLGLDVAGTIPSLGDHAYGSPLAAAAERHYDLGVTRLRNHLWRKVPGTATHCILVTAADAAAGKSLLAMRLAMIAATDGERVLLVDADPDASLPAEFDLPIIPLAPRLQDSRSFMPERGVAQIAGLRYVSVNSRTAKTDFKTVADNILARAPEFHAIVINAGLVGADLFTERLAVDRRLSSVLLAVSATQSRFAVIDRALTTFDRETSLAAVLTDASSLDV